MIDLPSRQELMTACSAMPLFPLPQVVLLPNTLLRLHVFEPRYVQLLNDSLKGNRLISTPRLSLGWENGGSEPPLFPVAGVGMVIHSESLPGDRYNIAILGLGRFRINAEHESDRLYRIGKGDLLEEVLPVSRAWSSKINELRLLLTQLGIQNPEVSGSLEPLLDPERPEAQFLNTLAHLLLRDPDKRQQFIEENDLMRRALIVEDALTLTLIGGKVIEE